jgi:hypothetical protein
METLRQQVSVTLREYVPRRVPTATQTSRLQGSKGKTRVVTAKQGDTPAKIARREHCAWTNLRDLNPTLVRKANQALKRGRAAARPGRCEQDAPREGRDAP